MKYLLAHKLYAILALALLIRLAVLLAFPSVFAFDQTGAIHGSQTYDVYARNLLATGVYGRVAGVPDGLLPPLYSYVLAGVYGLLGRGYLQVGLFHITLDLVTITLVYHLGRRLLPRGEAASALAALFYALYPYLIFQNLTLIDTPLFMVLLYAFLLALALLRQRRSFDRTAWALAVLSGVILGLSLLARAILPPLALLATLWFLLRLSPAQTVVRLLPVAIIATVVVLPWLVRNRQVYGDWVGLSLNVGENVYQGNGPDTVPYLRAGYDVQWVPPPSLTADDPLSPQANAERLAAGLAYLRDNPDKIPELLWVKFLVHWSIDIAPRLNPVEGRLPRLDYQGNVIPESGEGGALSLGGLPPGDPVAAYSTPLFDQIGRIVHRFYWGGLFLLGLAGVVLSRRHWRDVSLLWLVQISMTLVYVAFHPSTRYRVPTDPAFFLFSAYALVWAAERLRGWLPTPRR